MRAFPIKLFAAALAALIVGAQLLAFSLTPGRADLFATNSTIPAGAVNSGGLVYSAPSAVTIATSTPTSVFPPGSSTARTFPAGTLIPGKTFVLRGGGIYTVPAANTLPADIALKVGSVMMTSITTPAAPVGTNAGIDFHAECVVNTTTTMTCTGAFTFAVLGTAPIMVPFNSVTAKTFDPTVANTIDVLGDWNGTVSSQTCTVQTAILVALN